MTAPPPHGQAQPQSQWPNPPQAQYSPASPSQYPQAPLPPPEPPPQQPRPRTGFGKSLLAALVWVAVNFVLFVVVLQSLPSARGAGTFTGSVIIPLFIAAFVTWLIARRSRRPSWPFWQLVLLSLPFYWGVVVLLGAARAAGKS